MLKDFKSYLKKIYLKLLVTSAKCKHLLYKFNTKECYLFDSLFINIII